jgi:hypothetical protein
MIHFILSAEAAMSISLERMRECEDKRVKMRFDDDIEIIATILSASQDIDGSLHLIYDKVEWSSNPLEPTGGANSAMYAEGESLVSIDEMKS